MPEEAVEKFLKARKWPGVGDAWSKSGGVAEL